MASTVFSSVEPLRRPDAPYVAVVLAFGLLMLAPDLAHPTMRDWDEGFHQAAARGTYDTFFYPHLYADPLYPVSELSPFWEHWVWLHKPTAPLWFAAVVMNVIGVTPVALRLGSLLGQLG